MLGRRAEKGLEFAKKAVLAEENMGGELHNALEYYTSNWENFTHPGLLSLACEAVGGNPDEEVEIQAVVAMVGAALDTHDDIIDRSKVKHGRPTVFGQYGQDLTLILGDVFFVSGFTLLGKTIGKMPHEKMKEIFATLRKTLLELGNAHNLESELKGRMHVTPEEYMQILQMKAASVEADMRIGAIVGGGTKSEIEALTKYGRIAGILATLREEFVDVFEIEELCHRMHNECLPVPILYAIQDIEVKGKIEKLIAKRKMNSSDVEKLLNMVFEARSVKKLKEKMKDLIVESHHSACKIRNHSLRRQLQDVTSSTLEDI
jgi:geranylgeranyl pyrophosphate synthase